MHGRLAVVLLVVGVLVLAVAGVVVVGRTAEDDVSPGVQPEGVSTEEADDPAATLDAALAAREPVYVLIHSLT